MNVLIVGNDLRTLFLVNSMLQSGHAVTLISSCRPLCEQAADLTDLPAVCGDAGRPEILASAGAGHCDILICMLERDPDNLVVCAMAKKMFGVPRTLAIVEIPSHRAAFQKLGIDSVLCPAEACSLMVGRTLAGAV